MEQNSEKSETELEILIKDLEGKVEKIVTGFSEEEIAFCSGKIKPMNTMLENRSERERFIKNAETHKDFKHNEYYFEEQINEVKKDNFKELTSNNTLKKYFELELNRVVSIRDKLIQKCSNLKIISEIESEFTTLLQSLTQHIATCQDILNEFSASSIASYTFDDLFLIIKGQFVTHLKEQFVDILLNEASWLLTTKRYQILLDSFKAIEDDLSRKSQNHLPDIHFLPVEVSDLDDKLSNLAKTFGVTEELNEDSSQRFLYSCDKKFTDLWDKLEIYTYKEAKSKIKVKQSSKTIEELCDAAFISEIPIEEELNTAWDFLDGDNFTKIISTIKEDASNYNHLVNGYDYKTQTVLKRRKPLQVDKVQMFMKMRIARAKFLILLICTHLNQFEAMKANLFGARYTFLESRQMKHLIEVIDENGEHVFLDSVKAEFEKIKKTILHVCSYYITEYNTKTIEINLKNDRIIDTTQMICDMLEMELKYVNAKRYLIQSLYECATQDKDDFVVDTIINVIGKRPLLHINMFNTPEYGYNLSISKFQQQAAVIQTVVKLQIIHERHISATIDPCVPLFDRIRDTPMEKAMFAESVPISPLEHFSFSKIPRLISIIESMSIELAEKTDIRKIQFLEYVELSYWKEFNKRLGKLSEFLPFTIQSYPYRNELSGQPHSLIVTPILNNLTMCVKFIQNVAESRKLRFALNFLTFMNIGWKLQYKIIKSDAFQDAYISQSSRCGFNDAKIFMQSFAKVAKSDSIDSGETYISERVLDFAYVDFNQYELDFCNVLQMRREVDKGDFSVLKEIYSFQKLHIFLLDVAVSYNFFVLDNDLIVDHFGLAIDETSDLFLTAADNITPQSGNFVRSFMASTILLDSQYILDNYKKAQDNRDWYFVNIRSLKSEIRLILNAQAKQKEINYNMYINEMLEAFSAAAYRLEVAFICRIERQLLLLNSFCDAFILEPTSILLVTEAGRTQNHFVIPLWATIFRYCRTAPLQRQTVIFKSVVAHVSSVYRILEMVRFETSLLQRKEAALNSLLTSQYKMESSLPQKLFNELQRAPCSNEFDVCSHFVLDKAKFFELRMELGLLEGIDASFLLSDSAEVKLRESMLQFYHSMHKDEHCFGMSSARYSPEWTRCFFFEADEFTRNDLGNRLLAIDKDIQADLVQKQIHSTLESTSALNESINFLSTMISFINVKFTFFKLYNGVFSFDDPYDGMDQKQYLNANSVLNEQIIPQAHKMLTPKDDETSLFLIKPKTLEKSRFIITQIEALKNECDEILLAKQIDDTTKQRDLIPYILSSENVVEKPVSETFVSNNSPKELDALFVDDIKGSRSQLVKLIGSIVKLSKMKPDTSEKEGNDVLIDSDKIEDYLRQASVILYNFEKGSITSQTTVWHSFITECLKEFKDNIENDQLMTIFEENIRNRFGNMLSSQVSTLLSDSIFEINSLNRQIEERKHAIQYEDIESENEAKQEFETLVFDLKKQKEIIKGKFTQMRDQLYFRVQSKIKAAGETEFSVSEDFTPQKTVISDSIIHEKEEEIKQMKKKIIIMRIVRCMSNIATRRFFIKRIRTNENDGKFESAKLWETKREFEISEANSIADLRRYYQNLADDEIEIEKTRQMIDNEKQNTIQLVHWKATNQKREVELRDELKKYEGVDKTNISELIEKLNKAKETLEKLKKSNEELEIIHERDIKRPMTVIEKTRRKITASKIEKSNIIQSRALTRQVPQMNAKDNSSELVASIQEENNMLASRNESIRRQIEDYEKAKQSMPKDVREAIDEIKPSPRIVSAKKAQGKSILTATKTPRKLKGITRPVTAGYTQKPVVAQQRQMSSNLQKKRSETSLQFV